jgi:hypothetical protein
MAMDWTVPLLAYSFDPGVKFCLVLASNGDVVPELAKRAELNSAACGALIRTDIVVLHRSVVWHWWPSVLSAAFGWSDRIKSRTGSTQFNLISFDGLRQRRGAVVEDLKEVDEVEVEGRKSWNGIWKVG